MVLAWQVRTNALAVIAILTACGGSGFTVTTDGPVEDASFTGEGGADASDAEAGQVIPVTDAPVEAASSVEPSAEAAAGEAAPEASEPPHTCPSTCAQLNANCGAVADTFCGGLVQCGACATGVCGGAAPSTCGCPSGQLACAAGCVNPMTDSANCGKCGTSCAATSVQGEACVASVCACPAGTQLCAGQQATYCNLVYKSCF